MAPCTPWGGSLQDCLFRSLHLCHWLMGWCEDSVTAADLSKIHHTKICNRYSFVWMNPAPQYFLFSPNINVITVKCCVHPLQCSEYCMSCSEVLPVLVSSPFERLNQVVLSKVCSQCAGCSLISLHRLVGLSPLNTVRIRKLALIGTLVGSLS